MLIEAWICLDVKEYPEQMGDGIYGDYFANI